MFFFEIIHKFLTLGLSCKGINIDSLKASMHVNNGQLQNSPFECFIFLFYNIVRAVFLILRSDNV